MAYLNETMDLSSPDKFNEMEFQQMNLASIYMLSALASSQSMGRLGLAFKNVKKAAVIMQKKFPKLSSVPESAAAECEGVSECPVLTRHTLAYAISLSVSCICYICNDDANKGRADEVYEKALRDLELMSDEEFAPLLGKLIEYYVERVVSSEPLGPGHVRVTTTSGGGSGRIAAAADGGSAAAATVSGGGRGRRRAGAAATTSADDDESDEDKDKDKGKKSGAGGGRGRGRTSTAATGPAADEDNADKDKSKNNDKVSGTIAGDAVDKESGVSATPSPSKNAGPKDTAIPNVPAAKASTRGGGGQRSSGKGAGSGNRGGGAGPPAAAARD